MNPSLKFKHKYQWLDYLRFASALSVVAFHYLANGIRRDKILSYERFGFSDLAEYGHLGVDVFFLISGFVIMSSAQNATPSAFAIGRLVRIWPTFMLCMTITFLVRMLSGQPDFSITAAHWIINATMFAPYLGFEHVDSVYWTLSYEVLFYAFVWLLLLLGAIKHISMLLIGWCGIVVLSENMSLHYPLLDSYNAYFISGCFIALIRDNRERTIYITGFALSFAIALWGLFGRTQRIGIHRGIDLSPELAIAAIALVYIVFVFGVFSFLARVDLPFSRILGLATYPLYLLHAYVGYIVLNVLATPENAILVVPLTALAMILSAIALVKGFEDRVSRPLKNWLFKIFGKIKLRFGEKFSWGAG